MNQLSSATLKVGLLRLPPPQILHNEEALDLWFLRLSPQDRGRFMAYFNSLVASLPPDAKRRYRQLKTKMESTAVGVGSIGASGLGWVGAAISAAAQVGMNIYQTKENKDLQMKLSGQATTTQLQVAALQASAQQAIQETIAKTQAEAAETAGAAQVATAQQAAGASVARAQTYMKYTTPVLIAVALGGLLIFWKKGK